MGIEQIVIFFFVFTASLYLASFVLLCIDTNAESARKFAGRAAWLGFASHTLMLGTYVYMVSRAPFANPYEILVSLLWAFVFVQLVGTVIFKTRAILVFSMPAAALLLLLPLGCPLFFANLNITAENLKFISSAHVVAAMFSYALLALAAVVSGLYIVQGRSLRDKSAQSAFADSPSLKRLFLFNRWTLTLSAQVMFFAIVSGTIDARYFMNSAITTLYILKFSLGAFVFAMQIFLAAMAWSRSSSESRLCSATIFLAVLSFLLLIPMELKNFF